MDVLIQIGLLALGFVLLVKGADWFVEGASRLAEKFGIPQLVIGLTIVAMGTSLPEAAVSVSAALKGSAGITIGNIVGSNIMNILLILGLTALITPIAVQKTTVRYEIPFVILVSVVLVAMGAGGDHLLHFPDGLILWALMFCYLGYLLVIAKKGGGFSEEMPEEKPMPVWKMLLMIALGGVMIVAGSNVAVDAAFRRQGVATALLRILLEDAQIHRLSFVTLEVREGNLAAISFYRKLGFQEVGRVLHSAAGGRGADDPVPVGKFGRFRAIGYVLFRKTMVY